MSTEYAYIGIKSCGCVVACSIDDSQEFPAEVASTISEYITSGLTIERVKMEEARQRLKACRCAPGDVGAAGGAA